MFHQVEGLMVDKDITFSHLKGVLIAFIHKMFGPNIPVRFRPAFSRLPSHRQKSTWAAYSASLKAAGSARPQGGSKSSAPGWSTQRTQDVGYDPDVYTGFAFGMGVERITLLKYSIDDIRLLFENDIRFLRQF